MLFLLSYPSAFRQRYCQVSTFQHNVRRLLALLLSSIVHALIDSLRLATLPLTEVFSLFPVALSHSLLSSPKKYFRSLPFPRSDSEAVYAILCYCGNILVALLRHSLHFVAR